MTKIRTPRIEKSVNNKESIVSHLSGQKIFKEVKFKQFFPTFINTECICLFEIGQILTVLEGNFVCLSKFI